MSGSPLRAEMSLLRGRPAAVLVTGLVLALVAAASEIGLLALAGWFIASCWLAGHVAGYAFGYLTPSGGVRALALSRIVSRYLQRLVTHTATLQWLTRMRLSAFGRARDAGVDATAWLGSAVALDRAVRDTETVEGFLIRGLVPGVAAVAAGVAGTVAITAVSPVAGAAFAAGCLAVGALCRWSQAADPARGRAAARRDVVGTAEAWPALAGLGAAGRLEADALTRLSGLAAERSSAELLQARAQALASAASALTAAVTVALAAATSSLPSTALVALLAVGVLAAVSELAEVRRATLEADAAARRLRDLPAPEGSPRILGTWRWQDRADDRTLVVSGPSGAGKSTLLRGLAGEVVVAPSPAAEWLGPTAGRRVLLVADEPVLSGTVHEHLRVADPDVTAGAVEAALAGVGLTGVGVTAETRVGVGGRMLSTGETRRMALARAVLARPDVLLLDEPTEGLDAASARTVLAHVRAALPAASIVVVLHDREQARVGWEGASRAELRVARAAGPPAEGR